MMEKYSATYGNTAKNFVIQNITGEDVQTEYDGVICVIKNILQRGNPTPPSEYLKERLGVMEAPIDKPLLMISNEGQCWNNRIKGNSENESNNPAEEFFNVLIPEYFVDYAFVRSLMLPEAYIEEIAPTQNDEFFGQQVDFYLPQAKLVIEIDGSQHSQKLQTAKDYDRDRHLKRNGIKTIRIKTQSIHVGDQNLKNRMQEILEILKVCKEVNAYKDSLTRGEMTPDELLRIQYDVVLRFQLLVLSLLQKGRLKIAMNKWEITIVNSNMELENLLRVALDDVFLWFSHLCKLSKIAFVKPDVVINPKRPTDSGIVIDVGITKRWSDEAKLNLDVVFIRNDYFDNHDYFHVSTSDSIQYEFILEGEGSDIPDLQFCLRNLFGFDDFRDGQLPIIVNALRRQDTIGILPTGSGKSLCYQFTAMLQPCISFVVCPILALMYDQKDNLDKLGITRTNYINSDMKSNKKGEVLRDFDKGKYFLIWISPERFQTSQFRNTLQSINMNSNIALAVIDEVHCMSEWGHDFRTSYLNLVPTIKSLCPEASFLGLTATASQFVLEDLKREFEIKPENIKTISNVGRDELIFRMIRVEETDKYIVLQKLLNNYKKVHGENFFECQGGKTKSGLIFTVNKGRDYGCIKLSEWLTQEYKIEAKNYHAELLPDEKKDIQDRFKNNGYPLLAATKAFGMGIDKPNIRYTIHFGMPWSLESFYQEAGRAGRDQQQAECTIIYQGEKDADTSINKLFDINTEIAEISAIQAALKNDLRDIIYLWLQNNREINEDLETMKWVMGKIHRSTKDTDSNTILVSCDDEHKKGAVEKAIYKLTLLGFVKDWTVEAWGKTTAKFLVVKEEYTENSVREHLHEFIKRYDSGFDEHNPEYHKYFITLKDQNLKRYTQYMKILLMWSYDNIVYQRRQAIKTMWDACENYRDGATLARYIEYYFQYSDKTLILDQIVYNADDYTKWFGCLFKDEEKGILIDRGEIEKIVPSLQRYLESYRYNPGLNYLSGMIRLLCDKFQDPDGQPRLSDAFERISGFPQNDLDIVVGKTLAIGCTASAEGREQLGEFLTSRFHERAIQIHHALSDKTSLLSILSVANSKLEWLKEKIQW